MASTEALTSRKPILRVAVPSPLRQLFDYLAPDGAEPAPSPGCRVLVPFGRRQLVAIVVEVSDRSDLDSSRLRAIRRILDQTPLFPPALFKTLCWAADYYQHPIGEVFAAALPAQLRQADRNQPSVWALSDSGSQSEELLRRAPRQRALYELIRSRGSLEAEAIRAAGYDSAILRQLHAKGLIVRQALTRDGTPFGGGNMLRQNAPRLNEEQQAAVDAFGAAGLGYNSFLIDGVTGSGKTEVYMRAMNERLRQGLQCLLLVPEIGLTPQTVDRFQQRFHCPTVVLHSGLAEGERSKAWKSARDGSAGIVIGTRSAVFTPLHRPGMIVVDEEHDASFKQQEGFRYSARDLAIVRAREEGIPIILGSATPSLESLHNAASGKSQLLRLTRRATGANLASMEIVDVANLALETGLSETLLYRIGLHLGQGNQVLVFLNRRGFAPQVSCQDCGWVAECKDCVANLTLHSKPPALRCHHCGAVHGVPAACAACQSRRLHSKGVGTQQLERFLRSRFEPMPVLRIDRDSMRSRKRMGDLLQQIGRGDPCILLGTQLLAKGHHFPHITLVAIVEADAGLFSPDFRGQEQMVQTILQVAGRAGRAQRAGQVLVQSRHAAHPLLQQLKHGSYDEIAQVLMQERSQADMPPYSHLALIRANAKSPAPALEFLQGLAAEARRHSGRLGIPVDCLGPIPAPMEKRAGRFRIQLLLRSQSRSELHGLLRILCGGADKMRLPADLRWNLDVDPVEFV